MEHGNLMKNTCGYMEIWRSKPLSKERVVCCVVRIAIYKTLGLDLEQYEVGMNFFMDWDIQNASPCPCTTDVEVAIFLENHIKRLTHPNTTLWCDIFPLLIVKEQYM